MPTDLSTAAVVAAILVFSSGIVVALAAMRSAALAQRDLRSIAREQHESLMHFHRAGQSLAAHNLEMQRVDLAMKIEENRKKGLEIRAMEMAREPEAGAAQEARTRFGPNGKVVGIDADGL